MTYFALFHKKGEAKIGCLSEKTIAWIKAARATIVGPCTISVSTSSLTVNILTPIYRASIGDARTSCWKNHWKFRMVVRGITMCCYQSWKSWIGYFLDFCREKRVTTRTLILAKDVQIRQLKETLGRTWSVIKQRSTLWSRKVSHGEWIRTTKKKWTITCKGGHT